MPISELKEEVETIKDEVETIREDTEKLQEDLGVIKIYKEIIKSNKRANLISVVAIVMLFILVFILITTLLHNEKEFTAYRENSIDKQEIIEILKDSTYHGE